MALAGSAWVRYGIACYWLARDGSLPRRPLRFLAAACGGGLLRETGRTFSFSDRILQDGLAQAAGEDPDLN